MQKKIGIFYIVATPIGNFEDITLRALKILQEVDLILCEDTRKSSVLLKKYNIKKKLSAYNDLSNEADRKNIVNLILEGQNIALISDAGTPLISDPGFKLVRELNETNIQYTTIPGACSVIAALTLSSLPSDKFTFLGFLPPKQNLLLKILAEINQYNHTVICFETGKRLLKTLKLIEENYSSLEIALVKEISKIHEQIFNGNATKLTQIFSNDPIKLKGEFVILFAPKENLLQDDLIQNVKKVIALARKNISSKDLTNQLVKQFPLSKKEIYKLVVNSKT